MKKFCQLPLLTFIFSGFSMMLFAQEAKPVHFLNGDFKTDNNIISCEQLDLIESSTIYAEYCLTFNSKLFGQNYTSISPVNPIIQLTSYENFTYLIVIHPIRTSPHLFKNNAYAIKHKKNLCIPLLFFI